MEYIEIICDRCKGEGKVWNSLHRTYLGCTKCLGEGIMAKKPINQVYDDD